MSFDLPSLPAGWTFAPLESCAVPGSISYGVVQPGSPVVHGVPIIRVNNFRDMCLNLSDVMRIEPEVEAKYGRTRLSGGEVLLTLVGTIGQVAVVPRTCAGFNVARAVGVVKPANGIDAKWIAICLRSPLSQHLLGSRANTTVQTTINLKDVRRLPIPIPPLAEREQIADFISALDDRIALLRETNATLEAIAQALFKSWFVDFDPVRAKLQGLTPAGMDEATTALFPNSFEDSALGAVPKGGGTGTVGSLAELKGGKQLDRELFDEAGSNPVFGGAGVMGKTNLSNADDFVICVGRVGAYCGQFFWHQGRAWVNNNASHIRPRASEHAIWLYEWCKSVNIDTIKKGAAQPFVSNGDIAALMLVLPHDKLIAHFVDVVTPIYRRLDLVRTQVETFVALRDNLLPRLISGKLRIPDADSMVQGE